jgi:hypothetical protein
MPVHDGLIILPWTTRDSFVCIARSFLCEGGKSRLLLFFSLDRHIHVGNLKVHLKHKLDASDLGDDGKDFGAAPCIVDEWCISEARQTRWKVMRMK